MASHTITVSSEAYKRLKSHKTGKESFSEIILRNVPAPPARTAGELLEQLQEFEGKDLIDEELMRQIEQGRKRGRTKRLKHAA